MKRFSLAIAVLLASALALAACSGNDDDNDAQGGNTESTNDDDLRANSGSRTLVVYYSQKLPDGVDGTTGATDIVREGNNQYGANQYLAMLIASRVEGDTLRLTVERGHYPSTYAELAAYARNEADRRQHPALTSRVVDMSNYDNVIISTPVWWYSLPMPVLSFLDRYDLGGKHVFVATTHAGSGLADAISVVRREEPGAEVSSNGLAVRASTVSASTASAVNDWLKEAGV